MLSYSSNAFRLLVLSRRSSSFLTTKRRRCCGARTLCGRRARHFSGVRPLTGVCVWEMEPAHNSSWDERVQPGRIWGVRPNFLRASPG